jgi:hypothetical protein
MKVRFRDLLLYAFVISAMTYAVWQAGFSIVPVASAAWENGCCLGSNDCRGNLICYPKPADWGDCNVTAMYDPSCDCIRRVTVSNYCNPIGQPPNGGGGGHGGFLD